MHTYVPRQMGRKQTDRDRLTIAVHGEFRQVSVVGESRVQILYKPPVNT